MLTSRTLFTWKQKAELVGAVEERTKRVGGAKRTSRTPSSCLTRTATMRPS